MAKVLISIPEDFLETVDQLATQEQRSRSELIRQALRQYFRRSRTAQNGQAVMVFRNRS